MSILEEALHKTGKNIHTRQALLKILAEAESGSLDPAEFRFDIRWPIIHAVIGNEPFLIKLKSGLSFEVKLQSRIEKSLVLNVAETPEFIWEPQTTKLSCRIASSCKNVLIGGAYIGDQTLPVAQALQKNGKGGTVFAFEPIPENYRQFTRNIELNSISNVRPEKLALWNKDGAEIDLFEDEPGLASKLQSSQTDNSHIVKASTVTIDSYLKKKAIPHIDLVMMDMEGAEKQALEGARQLINQESPHAPHIIFEMHSDLFLKKNDEESALHFLEGAGYQIFGIRDLQGSLSMENRRIELIPLDRIYIAPVPHYFNMLATKDRHFAKNFDVFIVNKQLSPKLLSDKNTRLPVPPKDPALHLPDDGKGLELF